MYDNRDRCGDYDTADFIASERCCACGGLGKGTECVSDETVGGSNGWKCSTYYSYLPEKCGLFDISDVFVASEICCACGASQGSTFL